MKQILLIDRCDSRRETRELVLRGAGYEVMTAQDYRAAEGHLREATFDLVIVEVSTSKLGEEAVDYCGRLRAINPNLPILVLSDDGIFMPKETLINALQSGYPLELLTKVASMLLASTHVRDEREHKIETDTQGCRGAVNCPNKTKPDSSESPSFARPSLFNRRPF